jgi:RND family efflux transporter MFP subunit
MKRHDRVIVRLIALVVLGGLSAIALASDYQAVLDWADTYVVSFPVQGRVTQVYVSEGERINRGAQLIELDAQSFKIALGQFEAAVAAQEPVLAEAKREFEQAGSLYEQTVLSEVELQRKQHTFEQARAELAQANAALWLARWRLDQTRAVAPWDAWVIRRNVDPGQVLVDEQLSTPLLVLARDGLMAARTVLPAATISALRIGQRVKVVIGSASRDAAITNLGMQYEENGNAPGYRLEVRFTTTQNDGFRAGQSAVIQLP